MTVKTTKLNVTTDQFNSEVSRIIGNNWVIRGGSQQLYLISISGEVKELNGIPSDVTYYIRPHWSDPNKLFYWTGTSVYTYDINTQKSELYWNTGFTIIPRSVKGDRNDGEYNADGDYLFLFSETSNTGCRVANLTKKQWITKKAFSISSSFDHAQVAPSGDHIQISDADTSAYDFEGNKLFSITSYAGHMDTTLFKYKNQNWNGILWRQSNSGSKPGALMVTLYNISGQKEDVMIWSNPDNLSPSCTIGQVSASIKNKYFMCHISNTNEYCSDSRARRLGLIPLDFDSSFPRYTEVLKHNNIPSAVTSTQPEAFIGPFIDGKQYVLARITESTGKNLYIYEIETGLTVPEPPKSVDPCEQIKLEYAQLENKYKELEVIYNNLGNMYNILQAQNANLNSEIVSLQTVINQVKEIVNGHQS